MLNAEHVFEADGIRRKKYEETKPWIDRLHREFIENALAKFRFENLEPYKKAFEAWQGDKKSKSTKDALVGEEKKLREEVVAQFNIAAKEWVETYPDLQLKKVDIGVLFEAGIFRVLKERYKNETERVITTDDGKEVNIFDDWNGWTGYFKKFFQTRKNFYSDGDESTAVAYRIVNQNLRRFIQNVQLFERTKSKIDISKIEKDLGVSCSQTFSLENYSNCVLQDGIDAYNRILGGDVGENDEKIPGINQAINEYRQRNKDDKIPFLAMLDKQIHSEKEKFIDAIETNEELVKNLDTFANAADVKLNIFRKLIVDFASNSEEYDLNKIYISSEAFERNASRWFGDYPAFERVLLDSAKEYKDSYRIVDETLMQEKEGQVKYPDFLICGHIKAALDKISGSIFKERYHEEISGFENLPRFEQFLRVMQYEVEQQFSRRGADGKAAGYEVYRNSIASIINADKTKIDDKDTKISIKNFADSALVVYQIAKYFAVEKKRRWLDYFELDDRFYNAIDTGFMSFYGDTKNCKSAYEEIVQGYNALRNYLTKKPYSTDKWVLNFDIQTLADGWDKNKEKENGAVIFRKDGRYYLGIMHREHKNIFTEKYKKEFVGSDYEKMVYRQIANPFMDIHNLALLPDGTVGRFTNAKKKQKYWPPEITRIKEKKSYAKENFNRNDFEMFIDYMKKCATGYWPEFMFSFKPTSAYKTIKNFTDEIGRAGYKISFDELVSDNYLKENNAKGQLFIFEIHNKDWNLKDGAKKEGIKNLHTLYWEQLFSDENRKENFVFKLNGEAELFFRPKTEEKKLGYKKLDAKDKKWIKVHDKESGAVADRKRYMKDAVFFHCPITINRVSENKTGGQINADIRKAIADNKELRVIGVDRGEKHLAYYSIIDQNGKIDDCDSLNTVGETNGKPVPYANILGDRAKERETARREWQEIENIKDIKRGYVSQVVRKIVDLAIQHPNAIIVLEDLNMRFKQVRSGIEKSIYQQFEKQLIDKLSFLADKKETDSTKSGHPLKAYQLASPITAFKDMGKQTGIIFYTAAGYTSRSCPVCGFRRNVRFYFESVEKAKEAMKNLDRFVYDAQNDSFLLTYSLKKLVNKEQLKESKAGNRLYEVKPRKDIFRLTTKGAVRYKWFQRTSPRLRALAVGDGVTEYQGLDEQQTKRGIVKVFDITEYLKKLFTDAGIALGAKDLREAVVLDKSSKEFYEKLLFALFLLTETRQTISETDVDYIHCPECEFDSRKKFQGREFNGDANGAYNIARKGIMILEKIKQFKKNHGDVEKMSWGDLSISIEEWDKYTQIISRP